MKQTRTHTHTTTTHEKVKMHNAPPGYMLFVISFHPR